MSTDIEQPSYQVQLPVFEGPLDLLLHLIQQQQLDITTIALAKVTDQYLAYLAERKEATGRTFNVVDGHGITRWQHACTYLRAGNTRSIRVPVSWSC